MNISININTMSSDRPIPQKTRSLNPSQKTRSPNPSQNTIAQSSTSQKKRSSRFVD
ncbi:hypothetical protein [Pseudanabaena sp. BC1403]|uniref:hypothetical protein n=1 Tax=Pseudanabaena sp. BC1403 TaxID=2043171 RepID=UPI0015E1B9CF|nr:hypothetical protein [Pseudanabaena sp. BC1403]